MSSKVKPDQVKVIKELEELIGKPIPCLEEINGEALGYKAVDGVITEISLFYGGLSDLPKSFNKLKSLKVAYLLWNTFKEIPNSLLELKEIELIDLDANLLESLPPAFCNFESLQTLYLSNNKLRNLPKCFGNLKSLKKLYLTGNQLTTLPDSFNQLKSLRRLVLQENNFAEIPSVLLQLKSLVELNVIKNQLTKLPYPIWRMTRLKKFLFVENPWDADWKELLKNTLQVILDHCRKNDTISIFISHAWVDQAKYRILELRDNLENREEINEFYICEEDLVGDIQEFMAQKVPLSQLLLFIATPNSIKSEDCLHEIALALTHQIEIIPIKGMNISWQDLNQLDLSKEGMELFDLGEKKGFEYSTKDLQQFYDALYKYIKQFKREINLYDPERALIDKQILNIRTTLLNLIDSFQFKELLGKDLTHFEDLYLKLSAHEISPIEYYVKIGQLLSKISKNV